MKNVFKICFIVSCIIMHNSTMIYQCQRHKDCFHMTQIEMHTGFWRRSAKSMQHRFDSFSSQIRLSKMVYLFIRKKINTRWFSYMNAQSFKIKWFHRKQVDADSLSINGLVSVPAFQLRREKHTGNEICCDMYKICF